MGSLNMDDDNFQLALKSIIFSHLQELAKPETNGIKNLSDFLEIAQACHIETDHMLCAIVDTQKPLFIKMRELVQDLIKTGAEPAIIHNQIIFYTQELLQATQGQYPEQSLNNE